MLLQDATESLGFLTGGRKIRTHAWAFDTAPSVVTPMTYFSDREDGPPPRVLDDLPDTAWGGIVAAFHRAMDAHKFGGSFPEQCPDGQGISGTSIANLMASIRAQIPAMSWPPRVEENPGTIVAMDIVEFAWQHIAIPEPVSYHSFFRHDHYRFDQTNGRAQWRDEVNRILARNGVALELNDAGDAVRIGPPSFEAARQNALPASGDPKLDQLLESAVRKFRDPNPIVRREALEPLWDAFERVKTILDPDKKTGAEQLIQRMAADTPTQEVLRNELVALTGIGNDFQIRHHETTKAVVPSNAVDYLFVRVYSLLNAGVTALAGA